ncbi:MAG: ABC transporter substrate-binding protein [Oscillospiraceae bacterium]|nr:ABC transporter substrate-binding protein [Oscillospiraceae bacterium]
MKRFITILILLCLVAALFGCGQEGAYVPTGDGLTPVEGETVYVPPVETEQKLTMTYYADRSMNPFVSTDYTNRALFSLLYQGLFAIDRNYNPQPILCSRYTVSKDLKTYTFYLDEKATFSNGAPVTAQDVLASYQTAQRNTYYGGRFKFVSSMALSGDGGITIKMKSGYENLPLLLDIPVVPAGEVAKENPLGSGPYLFTPEKLIKRTDWWCRADMSITAEAIALQKAESTIQIRDEFTFGNLNLVCADPGSDKYADYRGDYELWDCENGIFLYLTCNSASTVFKNETVRKALTHAIDRETLAEDYYRGFARPAALPASPLSPYYSTVLAEKYGYDPVKFAEALKDTNLRGTKIKILVNKKDTLRLRTARKIGQMLTDCGLVVEMKELTDSSYTSALRNWDYDLYVGQTKLSANMDLSEFFSTNGTLSWGGISDVTTYTLCRQAIENHGNYYTLHQNVMENGYLCPVLFRSYGIYATRGLLTGLTPARDNVFFYTLGKTVKPETI